MGLQAQGACLLQLAIELVQLGAQGRHLSSMLPGCTLCCNGLRLCSLQCCLRHLSILHQIKNHF